MTQFQTCCLVLALLLAGCGPEYSPNTYASSAVQQASKVDRGVVVGVRDVRVSASGTTGAIAGGASGAILGAQVPGSGLGQAMGAVGGTLVGGLVGAGVEHSTSDTTAVEYIVRKDNGDLLSVTQKDLNPLHLGQHVLVISGSQARIVPDYTVEPPETSVHPVAAMPTSLPVLPTPAADPPPPPTAASPAGSSPPALHDAEKLPDPPKP